MQVDLFVLEGAPESFDEDVVPSAAPPVHADLDAVLEQAPGEGGAGELTALIGVEDGRRPVAGSGGRGRQLQALVRPQPIVGLPEELLLDRLAERFISELQARGIGGLSIAAGEITKLILSVRRGFVHHLGDLIGS